MAELERLPTRATTRPKFLKIDAKKAVMTEGDEMEVERDQGKKEARLEVEIVGKEHRK